MAIKKKLSDPDPFGLDAIVKDAQQIDKFKKEMVLDDMNILGLVEFRMVQGEVVKPNVKRAAEKAVQQALDGVAMDLEQALKRAVDAMDVKDTGKLKNSGEVNVVGMELVISYGVDYAAIQHFGGYIQPYGNPNASAVYINGRPWITETLRGRFGWTFQDSMNKHLR